MTYTNEIISGLQNGTLESVVCVDCGRHRITAVHKTQEIDEGRVYDATYYLTPCVCESTQQG